MAKHWLPMEAAAMRLSISYRTLQRRIKAGRFETRELSNGSKEVLLELPDPPAEEPEPQPAAQTVGPEAAETKPALHIPEPGPAWEALRAVMRRTDQEMRLAAGTISMSQSVADRSQRSEKFAQHQARQARWMAICSWALLALMVPGTWLASSWFHTSVSQATKQAELAELEMDRLSRQFAKARQRHQRMQDLTELVSRNQQHLDLLLSRNQQTLAEIETLRTRLDGSASDGESAMAQADLEGK
jgi:hypothetical protein